jgi:hypothetical protein
MFTFGIKDGFVKLTIGWLVVFVVRLMPFRPPNVEPILSTLMPFSKKYGLAGGFFFAFLSIVLFDIAVAQFGIWTLTTGLVYGLVGLVSGIYFRNRESKAVEYLKFSLVSTLIYDAITGPGMAYVFGHPLTFQAALVGQIPFTLLHLLGNGILALTVSPMLYRWVVANPKLEAPVLFDRFAFSKR